MNAEDKELIHRHLNGDLDGAEQAAFFARLQSSPEMRRELASLSVDETLISELLLEKRAVARPRRRAWVPAAAAALMLLALSLILSLGRGAPTGILLVSVDGEATLQRGDRAKPLQPGRELLAGDRLQTSRGTVILDRSGGRIELEDHSTLFFHEKGVTLNAGAVRAMLPQNHELQLHARRGHVIARGATCRVKVSPDRTWVETESGAVTVEGNGSPVRLAAGQFASIGATVETGRLVPRAKVDDAVRRGCAFLESRLKDIVTPITSEKRNAPPPRRTYAELALLALHRGGYSDAHPVKAELLGLAKGRSVESTYIAAVQAVVLAELDPTAHHERIRACAQLLVDSQCANGQWDYAVKPSRDVPAAGRIRRRQDGPPSGDNSVTAYAALGLHACARAGVDLDPDVLERARSWWLKCQNKDGGWGYNEAGDLSQNGPDKPLYTTNTSYGTTTASAVAALAALREIRNDGGTSGDAIRRGVAWLGENFAADHTPRKAPGFLPVHWLERAGRAGQLLAVERFGAHEWYAEGAEFLLRSQHPTGEWRVEQGDFLWSEKNDVLDTCLAIVFLRRDSR